MFIDLAFRLLYLLLFGVGVILIRALLAEIDRQLRPKKGPMGFQVPPPPKKGTTAKPQSRLNQPPTTGYKPRNKPPATTKPAVTVYTAKKPQTAQSSKPALPPAPPPPASPPASSIPDSLPLLSEQPITPKPRDLFVKDKTRRKLMTLVTDRATAERLLKLTREYNPERSEQWCYEKVIYDIERDRRA